MNIPQFARKAVQSGTWLAKKYAPEILTGVGIVGVVGAGVMGARATLQLEETVDRSLDRLDTAKRSEQTGLVVKAYVQNVNAFTKLYGPTIIVGGTSIFCILAAHGIMRRRNVALAAAYAVLDKSYQAYRGRVEEVLGEEKEQELYSGIRSVEVTDPETGRKSHIKVLDANGLSPYSRVFDEHNIYWQDGPGYNKSWLFLAQSHMNDLLQTRGYLFLNEVYRRLGMPETAAGQAVGWTINGSGDDFVDFRMHENTSEAKRDFINGLENSIWLDFNVDGPILSRLRDI